MFSTLLTSALFSKVIYTFYVLITALIIGIFTYQIILWKRFKYWKQKNIQQIEPTFPTGNFQDVLLMRKCIGEFLMDMYLNSKGDLVGFYIFHQPHILIRSPDIIKQVLVSDFSTFHDRTIANDERADPISSKLLLIVKNPEWRVMRQKVTPIFTASKIRSMTSHVNKACTDWLKYIDDNHHKGPLESKDLCMRLTTDIISSCAFGVEADSFKTDEAMFHAAGKKLTELSFMNGFRFMSYFLLPIVVKMFRIAFFDRKAMAFLRDAFLQTIGQRESVHGKPRGDLIDIILELKKNKQLSNGITFEGDRVVAQAIQFFSAGFETTSATISFALYELSINNNIQDELRQSVRELIQDGGKFDYDSMMKLPLMERVILETLRKYPSLPFLDRRCNKDFTTSSGLTIPKDTPIFIPAMGLHYNEEYYPNPHKFDPDRFLPEVAKNRHPFVYLPFGQGPRNCIGERFAMNAVKICLGQLLLKYKVLPCAKTPNQIAFSPRAFVLIATKGIPLRFVKL